MGSGEKPATIMFRLLVVASLLAICCEGVKSQGKVLGGEPISIEEVPYQVAILYDGSLRCAGAIVTDRVIVSAAKCYRPCDSGIYQIRAGSNNYNKGGQIGDVRTVITHEKYLSFIVDYDIALFVLYWPIKLDGVTTAAVSLPPPGVVLPPGTLGLAAGWGSDSDDGVNWSEDLLALRLPAVEWTACKNSFAQIFRVVTANMICAGTAEIALCNGDTGTPLVVDNVLVGVKSWNAGCFHGPWNWPDVFSSASYFSVWLQKRLELIDMVFG